MWVLMIDNLPKTDKIIIANRVCYGNQIKTKYGELSEKSLPLAYSISPCGSPFFIGRLGMTTKECNRRHRAKLRKETPWLLTLKSIKIRCGNRNHRYFKRGIRNYLGDEDLKFLWFRDEAYLLNRPSIDRKDNDGNYTLENCRFIECIENSRLGGKIGGKLGWDKRKKTENVGVCYECGCIEKPHLARGMCKNHYRKFRAEKIKKGLWELYSGTKLTKCNECGGLHHAKGLCKKHYKQKYEKVYGRK